MAGYWPGSFIAVVLTSTSSWYIKMQKRTWAISSHLDFTLDQKHICIVVLLERHNVLVLICQNKPVKRL